MSIGMRLKTARKARKCSQDTLADMIGVSRGVITNIEGDKVSEPQPLVINAICNTLNISRDWLINGTGSMTLDEPVNRQGQILKEIYMYSQELSEEEQKYILDLIKTYKQHRPLE